MNKGIHLDLDTWIIPGQIPTGKPPLELITLVLITLSFVEVKHWVKHTISNNYIAA